MKILIDMDSIVVNLQDAWYKEYNEVYGDTLHPEDVTEWDVAKFCKHGDKVFEILKRPCFFLNLKPLPGAIEGVRALMAAGHEVYFITSAPQLLSYTEKAQWLRENIPEFDLKRLIITYSKAMVKGDVLFDDGPHNIIEYRKAWGGAWIATISYPYNVDAEMYADFIAGDYTDTACAWQRFVAFIKDVEGGRCDR